MGLLRRSKKFDGKSILTRRFLGKTDGFTSKGERHFCQRSLYHYLKGHKYFIFRGMVAEVEEKEFYV